MAFVFLLLPNTSFYRLRSVDRQELKDAAASIATALRQQSWIPETLIWPKLPINNVRCDVPYSSDLAFPHQPNATKSAACSVLSGGAASVEFAAKLVVCLSR